MRNPVYLDYAATTPVDPRVARQLCGFLTLNGQFANPASTRHRPGRAAAEAIERARQQVAALLNCTAGEIVFTSGATEANNLALQGAARGYSRRGRHIVTCKSEHKAVLDVCRALARDGFAVTYLDPGSDGLLSATRFAAALRDDTVLASIMHVNNETGVIQDIAALGRIARERGVLFHVDAAQSAGKIALDVEAANIDLLSLCGHKLYAPKGVGALYVRRRPKIRLQPLLHGGGHEQGLRPGTLATHQIVAFGAAAALAAGEMAADAERTKRLCDRLWAGLAALGGVVRHGHPERSIGTILNVSFTAVSSEALLDDWEDSLAVATGSACTSAAQEPSHVLQSMGIDATLASNSIRFSVGRFSSDSDIDQAICEVTRSVTRLRAISPLWPVAS